MFEEEIVDGEVVVTKYRSLGFFDQDFFKRGITPKKIKRLHKRSGKITKAEGDYHPGINGEEFGVNLRAKCDSGSRISDLVVRVLDNTRTNYTRERILDPAGVDRIKDLSNVQIILYYSSTDLRKANIVGFQYAAQLAPNKK